MNDEVFFSGGFFHDPETDRILLHLRDHRTKVNPGKWAFIGGSSEAGEDPLGCLRREVLEEVGVFLQKEEAALLRSYFNVRTRRHRHTFLISRSPAVSDIVVDEGSGVAWIRMDEALAYDLTDGTREDLEFFLASRTRGGAAQPAVVAVERVGHSAPSRVRR